MTDGDRAYEEARELYERGDYTAALQAYRALAAMMPQHGELYAFIGKMYAEGRGTAINLEDATGWYSRALEAGYWPASLSVARLLGRRDLWAQARTMLEVAALQGYSPAMYYLGMIHKTGRGTVKDQERALLYFRRAATQGHVFARKEVALHLIRGGGGILMIFKGIGLLASALWTAFRTYWRTPNSDTIRA